MAIETDKLSALDIKHLARETAPAKKHFDGGGLYLDVRVNGSRYWRMAYRFARREKLLSLGVYPEVSLAEARRRRDVARALLRDGTDPMAVKADRKTSDRRDADASFAKVAAWLTFKRKEWATETHRKAEYVVDTYLAPALRRQSITTLKTKDAVEALQGIPPSLASKARQYLGGIVHYAIREGLREDGRLLSLRGAISSHRTVHIPAATSPADVRKVAALAVHSYGVPVTRIALQIAMLTAQRPGSTHLAYVWRVQIERWLRVASKNIAEHRLSNVQIRVRTNDEGAICSSRQVEVDEPNRPFVQRETRGRFTWLRPQRFGPWRIRTSSSDPNCRRFSTQPYSSRA